MTTTLRLWFSTVKTTLTNLGALVVFTIIYAILLATFFRFIWIREATVWQVLFTYAFMVLIPAVFFIFQASIIDRARDRKFHWRAILLDALKFFVVTIPVLLIVWLIYYLLNKLAGRFPAPPLPVLPIAQGAAPPRPLHWPTLIFSTLRFVLFAVALPLASIHLWIAFAGGEIRERFKGGAKPFLKRIGTALARAFSSESVLIYALGLIVFFVLPYVILVPTLTIKGNKTEFAVFVLRLVVSFLFTLVGWVVTISALTRLSLEESPAVSPQPIPDVPAEAAA
jgi:hypothetical protein